MNKRKSARRSIAPHWGKALRYFAMAILLGSGAACARYSNVYFFGAAVHVSLGVPIR